MVLVLLYLANKERFITITCMVYRWGILNETLGGGIHFSTNLTLIAACEAVESWPMLDITTLVTV